MTREDWMLHEIENVLKEPLNYEEQALLLSLKEVVQTQYHRLTLAEGELDGTLWSPKNW